MGKTMQPLASCIINSRTDSIIREIGGVFGHLPDTVVESCTEVRSEGHREVEAVQPIRAGKETNTPVIPAIQ